MAIIPMSAITEADAKSIQAAGRPTCAPSRVRTCPIPNKKAQLPRFMSS
jgi:hypothetical protein